MHYDAGFLWKYFYVVHDFKAQIFLLLYNYLVIIGTPSILQITFYKPRFYIIKAIVIFPNHCSKNIIETKVMASGFVVNNILNYVQMLKIAATFNIRSSRNSWCDLVSNCINLFPSKTFYLLAYKRKKKCFNLLATPNSTPLAKFYNSGFKIFSIKYFLFFYFIRNYFTHWNETNSKSYAKILFIDLYQICETPLRDKFFSSSLEKRSFKNLIL